MEIPSRIKSNKHYWKLKKALYGLKQAGRQWKQCLHEVLSELGFTRAYTDDCLYILQADERIVLVHVDNMIVASPDLSKIVTFKHNLAEYFEISDLGELEYMLGILITRDRPNHRIYLNQTSYIHSVLNRFGMQNCYPVSTPLAMNHGLCNAQCPNTMDEINNYKNSAQDIQYLSLVGSLLFATQTRPDIQFVGTMDFSLVLGRCEKGEINLVGWSDASWAQDTDTRKSVSGYVLNIAEGTVSWSSKKQTVVVTSSVEAEYIASANATKEAVWLCSLLSELNFPQNDATIIHSDSQGCIALSNSPVAHSHAKHIDIRFHFIRDCIEKKKINLKFVGTKDMLADIFTKALPRESFVNFWEHLGVIRNILSSGSVEGDAETSHIYMTKE